MIKNRITAY